MKKSEMNDIQKANYEYMRSLGIKKSWAKRLVSGDGAYADNLMFGEDLSNIVLGFTHGEETEEGFSFWGNVYDNACGLLTTKSYHKALHEIPNNLVKDSK